MFFRSPSKVESVPLDTGRQGRISRQLFYVVVVVVVVVVVSHIRLLALY